MSTQTQPSRSLEDMPDTRQCREWLQAVGLRFSMPRLKVVEALCTADEERGVSARELHQQLNEAGEPLSLISVRQVLRRMAENGMVQATGRSRYRLTALDQCPRSSSAA
ncbi:transcriptional repressor [Pseudomonas sp. SH1-B]